MGNKKNSNTIINVSDVKEAIEMIAPPTLQESWDNSGLIIGYEYSHVNKIMTCLEINNDVLEEALKKNVDMIVTHHPLIFGAIRSLCTSKFKENIIMRLISSGISVYSCHTPFDKVKGGNNDIIAEKLGLTAVKNLCGEDVGTAARMAEKPNEADIGRIGEFRKPMKLKEVIDHISGELELSLRQINIVGSLELDISRVGICTGAGADLLEMAANAGCDLFITGDVKYHEAQTARELGICLIDAGHYGTEKFFGTEMKDKLSAQLGDRIEIIASEMNIDPFQVL